MPRFHSSGEVSIYPAAEQFVTSALRQDDSLFTPGHPVWALPVIEDLAQRFVAQPDDSKDTFEAKFRRQLEGAPAETYQLAAEVIFVHFLVADRIHGSTKRNLIQSVLDWSPQPVTVPPDLDRAIDGGVAYPGTAFHTQRPYQLAFLVEFIRSWKRLDPADREQRLADPWLFRDFLFSLPIHQAYTQREALLHLVHPDVFERILSREVKRQIAQAFSNLVSEPAWNVDQQIAHIRARLAETYGPDFDFYDEPAVARKWRPPANPWDEFIKWARRIYNLEKFDEWERNYKLVVAANLRETRDALFAGGEEWIALLQQALHTPNNLTNWRFNDDFLKWCRVDPNRAASALRLIWDETITIGDRFDRFTAAVSQGKGRMTTADASVFHMVADPTQFPVFRPTPLEQAFRLTSCPGFPREGNPGAIYEHVLDFYDRIIEEGATRVV